LIHFCGIYPPTGRVGTGDLVLINAFLSDDKHISNKQEIFLCVADRGVKGLQLELLALLESLILHYFV
jgi:hypothetical protein